MLLYPSRAQDLSQPDLRAKKTYELIDDADSSGNITPGDTVEYTISVFNRGDAEARGVRLTDPLDPNTSLLPASVKRVDLAACDDHYISIANVGLNVEDPLGGILQNDVYLSKTVVISGTG